MEPWREVSRSTEALADDGSLEAAREEFKDWDFIEVPYGFLAVPAGTPVVRSTTLGGLTGKLRRRPEEDG
jgi:hypothetical protein